MRIRTGKALRSIDRWKTLVVARYDKYVTGVFLLLLALPRSRRAVPIGLALIFGLSVNFAAVQFALLLVLGVASLRLYSYKFANMLLRLPSTRAR